MPLPTSEVQDGLAVNFAFGSQAGITVTGISGFLLQDADHSFEADRVDTRDGQGKRVNVTFFDFSARARLRWIPSDATIAGAITNSALMNIGTFFVITACAKMPEVINSYWFVLPGHSLKKTNTAPGELEVSLERLPSITAAAS